MSEPAVVDVPYHGTIYTLYGFWDGDSFDIAEIEHKGEEITGVVGEAELTILQNLGQKGLKE